MHYFFINFLLPFQIICVCVRERERDQRVLKTNLHMDNYCVYLHRNCNYKYILHNKNSYDIYTHTHALVKPRGGWGSHRSLGFLKFPITLLKKSQIRQKNLSLAPLEKLDFIIGCTNFLTSPIKVKPNQAKLIQNTQK